MGSAGIHETVVQMVYSGFSMTSRYAEVLAMKGMYRNDNMTNQKLIDIWSSLCIESLHLERCSDSHRTSVYCEARMTARYAFLLDPTLRENVGEM